VSTAAGLAGGAGYLIGAGLYVKAIWAPGRQKPDRLSWLGWSIQATALTLPLSQALSPTGPAGYATVTALALPAAQALSSWLIFALTLRRGRGRSLTDWPADVTTVLGTAAAVTLWAASGGAELPTAALLVIEGIGIARTAWWAWRSPGCEPLLPWCVWAGCGACEFFAVPAGASWVAAWCYPVFYLACGLLVAGVARRRQVPGAVSPGCLEFSWRAGDDDLASIDDRDAAGKLLCLSQALGHGQIQAVQCLGGAERLHQPERFDGSPRTRPAGTLLPGK